MLNIFVSSMMVIAWWLWVRLKILMMDIKPAFLKKQECQVLATIHMN
ncbi:hypothetical protein IYQ_23040 [Aeromonas salmonicida subsp. salmonicida 01-B526]|uniref:Uncharacterized protein n=1 Tax=Aeromonas salmonicida subsp. salmonicida 01-B526 TaxID=1076135 RepID=A0ABN0DTK4_AERSS|nr:hypothetical protein IYQ_23040 [Aeromonas salmonicida subsp. salmonicida 01-B526]